VCQPVDVGVNKPLKTRMRSIWEVWMINEGLRLGTTVPPTRSHIAGWCSNAHKFIPATMIRSSWQHGPLSYFVPTDTGLPPNASEEGTRQ
jgi:hypothetical protein